mgnify:CR=1 FL=1
MVLLSVLSGAAAGLGSFAARKWLRWSSVQASAAVALAAGLLLPPLHREGAYLAAVCACASYAAMSGWDILPGSPGVAACSALCGLLMYAARDCLPGVGGRLGTCAAVAVLVVAGLRPAAAVVRKLIK